MSDVPKPSGAASNPRGALPRISSEPGALGDLVRAAQRYTPPLDQSAAFTQLLERAQERRRQVRTRRAWGLGFSAAAVLIAALSIRSAESPEPGELTAPVAALHPEQPERPPPALDTAPSRALALPAGESHLADGSRVRVAPASSARVEESSAGVRVELEQGTVSVDVAKQASGRSFEVHAAVYRFVAIGTSFSVSASGERIELDVREGGVAVLEGPSEIARVGAGEHWSPPPATLSPTKPKAPPARPPRASASDVDCLTLARERRTLDAESCFLAQAKGTGLAAELSLIELARLRSDVLGDPAGAIAALEAYRARFPSGSLRGEVDVSRVHLLARLGRHAELLAESARLLEAATGRERSAELHMLRANTFRAGLKDFGSAEREYAHVEQAGGKFAADAAFHRGECLEALGDANGAAAAYRRYLEGPDRPRSAEAQRRLKVLTGR